MTPGNNPEDFKQHYDHGGSLQLHVGYCPTLPTKVTYTQDNNQEILKLFKGS
jgi:hypothetical protein